MEQAEGAKPLLDVQGLNIAFAKGKNFANIFSLVLRAFQLGRSFGSRKKYKK